MKTYCVVMDYSTNSIHFYTLEGTLTAEAAIEALSDKHNEDECYYMFSDEPIAIYNNGSDY